MKTKIIIILVLLVLGSDKLYSQIESPIGKWILTEHLVTDKFDSISGCWTEQKNVLSDDFKVFIIFDSCGFYYQQIGDSAIHGSWKLKRNNRKLKIKFAEGGSCSYIWKTPVNFNKPLYISENIMELYSNEHDSSWGGESKYVRLIQESQTLDSNLFLGKWKICFSSKLDTTKTCKGEWTYEFLEDGTYTEKRKYTINSVEYEFAYGTWSFENGVLTIDENDSQWYESGPNNYKLTKIKEGMYYEKGIEGVMRNKIIYVFTYFQKVK